MTTKGRPAWSSNSDIRGLPLPAKGNQILYPDRADRKHSVPGLAVRVTAGGARSFVVDRNTARGRIRITLAAAGTDEMTLSQARHSARVALGLIAQGFPANQVREKLDRQEERIPSNAVTLGQVLDRYLRERRHKLAESSRDEYRRVLDHHLADWMDRPLEVISEESVVAKFNSIDSPSRANLAFKVVRALMRYARSMRKDDGTPVVTSNPVDVLSTRRLWHDIARRKDVIGLHAMAAWWKAVKGLAEESATRNEDGQFEQGHVPLNADPETARDLIQFLILTGLRRSEAISLQWETVDLRGRFFTVPDTKNNLAHTLPMGSFLFAMLERRSKNRSKDPRRAPYVFPGLSGHLKHPEKMIQRVERVSGVAFTAHTCRRSFATAAESLDVPFLALKKLLNHADGSVTSQYTVISVERLREPMQKIEDFILRAAAGE